MPARGSRLDLDQLSRYIPAAHGLVVIPDDVAAATRLAGGIFTGATPRRAGSSQCANWLWSSRRARRTASWMVTSSPSGPTAWPGAGLGCLDGAALAETGGWWPAHGVPQWPINGSTDPQLVDEQLPQGVELVVADPCREDQRTRVVERDPRGLVDDFPVDVRPEQPGGVGRASLGGEGLPELRVYPGTAELAVVQVGGIARDEGVATEQRPEEVPWRGGNSQTT